MSQEDNIFDRVWTPNNQIWGGNVSNIKIPEKWPSLTIRDAARVAFLLKKQKRYIV